MILTANEGRQQHSFFIPQLGPAPKWCSFLDNLVEEMAEDPNDPNAFTNQKAGEVYDNYKFLTIPQLQTINLSHLIGTTSLLKPYMHGYFVAQRLYEEAKLIADPFVWEDERNKRVKEKIDSERESRIRGDKKVTAKVNRRLAEKINERARKNERRKAQRVLEKGGDDNGIQNIQDENVAIQKEPDGLLTDPRFAKLFEDEDFAIDETSREFHLLNPSTKPAVEGSFTDGDPRKLTGVEEEALDVIADSDSDSDSDSDDLSLSGDKPTGMNKDIGRISSASYKKSGHRSQRSQIRVSSSKVAQAVGDRSFESRVNSTKTRERPPTSTLAGDREISFAPQRKKKAAHVEKPLAIPLLYVELSRASSLAQRLVGLVASDAKRDLVFSKAMTANALIYHPTVSHYLRFVATTAGRDKLLRTIQYFSRFYAWYLYRTNTPTRLVAPFKTIVRQFALCRKTLRLGKNVEHFKAAAFAYDSKPPLDEFQRYCTVGRQLGYAMYLSLDMMTFLDSAGIRKWEGARRMQREAMRAWAVGLLFSMVGGGYGLLQLSRREKGLDRKEGEGVVEGKKIT
ncbi:MAG: hypothetical protein Q9214_006470, partial [Letrouitia sp. 1 TL-2023]